MQRIEAYNILRLMYDDATEEQRAAISIAMDDIEFADLVPVNMEWVVHCEDCKHYHDFDTHFDCNHPCGLNDVRPVDYCSYGKRKDGE